MKKAFLIFLAVVALLVIALAVSTNRTMAPMVPTQPSPTDTPVTPAPKPATKDDLIVLDYPLTGSAISSPLTVRGKARGNWYFEASFPISLVNWDGLIIGEGYATAQGEWMTTEYVPFTGTITFTRPDTQVSDRGWIILKKNNASGEPKFDNALEVEIKYK